MDKLEEIIAIQSKLNDTIFQKKDIRDRDGNVLSVEKLQQEASKETIGPNTEVNEWLRKYLDALDDESRELREELLWKWWSKDSLNMQNIRVEIIDQLHFWISLALTAGLDAQKIYDIYMQKNTINFKRQESGYSKANKTEADNESIST
ncbi:MAG: dUTP diphosphatase [Fibrobacteria bacterium]|nr:dUTP diphosphatase [Fibrobacteria bacterium]